MSVMSSHLKRRTVAHQIKQARRRHGGCVRAPGDDLARAGGHISTAAAATLPQAPLDGGCRVIDAALDTAALFGASAGGWGRVARRDVPVAAPVTEEGEVLHVLARRHGRNTLELELHSGNLLKHLCLQGVRAGHVSTRTGTNRQGCESASEIS